jgi:hypothetical protein
VQSYKKFIHILIDMRCYKNISKMNLSKSQTENIEKKSVYNQTFGLEEGQNTKSTLFMNDLSV